MHSTWWIIIAILLPIVGGCIIPLLNFRSRKAREIYVMTVVLTTSFVTLNVLLGKPQGAFALISLTSNIDISFYVDGVGSVFSAMVALLWPLATLYAFEYMSHEHRENTFFTYYTITFGITLGVAFSANLITMYLFCEMLTFITLPLIMHGQSKEAGVAGVKYLVYLIAGATAAFIGIIIFYVNGGNFDFAPGGMATEIGLRSSNIFYLAFLLMFFGFGAKAAIFPIHDWLPTAGVAPTPVTALLHAVAVVKSGVFALIRLSYFSFGAEFLIGTQVQKIVLTCAIITIMYGSVMAWREMHFKKRLAYSTMSNLSYMLFGIMLLTPAGLAAGLLHMVFHGVMKITLFFIAGAVACQSHRYYVSDLWGFGKKMPVTFAVFTIASLALAGVPPLCGFISKWYLAQAAISDGSLFAYAGVGAILFAAVFTAVYLFTIVIRAYFPRTSFDPAEIQGIKDPGKYMLVPLVILAAVMILSGLHSGVIMTYLNDVAISAF